MCLGVNANGWGDGKDSHVSVFIFLMKGEYDESLKWPFQGDVTIQLLSRTSMHKEHFTRNIKFDDSTNIDITGRVTIGERAGTGLGLPRFICHADLLFKTYLINDSLCLCVKYVKLTSV